MTLASLVPILVNSGYVGAPELGLLCQTSNALYRATRDDTVWACLCHNKWPCTKFLPNNFLKSNGHRWLYKQWMYGPQDRLPCPRPLAPPTCTANDFIFFVHITYKNRPLVSFPVSGGPIESLLQNGCVDITFFRPGILCKAVWSFFDEEELLRYKREENEDGLAVRGEDLNLKDLSVQVHLLRESDLTMCCVFEQLMYTTDNLCSYVHPLVEEGIAVSSAAKFDLSKPQIPRFVGFSPVRMYDYDEGLPLTHSDQALEIKNRLRNRICFGFIAHLSVVEGGIYAVTGCELRAINVGTDGVTFEENFNSVEEAENHGVTLLHILSELQTMDADFGPERFT